MKESNLKLSVDREDFINNTPFKSKGLNKRNNFTNQDEKSKLISNLNSLNMESSQNNINIFTNKNISLNSNTKNSNNNYFDRGNSEKTYKSNNNVLASNHSFDNSNQKLNFNFNFNFPSEECQKFLNRKRQANDDKKNKNFNVNLNLNVNLNTSNNLNSCNSESSNKYSDKLRSLKENKSLSNQALKSNNNLFDNNDISFPELNSNINGLNKKLRFLNLKTRSSKDLLNNSFSKKFLGEEVTENNIFDKKPSFDFEKYSNNFQKKHRKRLIESITHYETRKMNKLNEMKNQLKFDFDLLNVNLFTHFC